MNLPRWARPAIAGVVLAGAAAAGYWGFYASPRAALERDLERQLAVNARYEDELKDREQVTVGLRAFATTTLGSKEDEVDAAFRTALGQIVEKGCGLTGIHVSTRKQPPVVNPGAATAALLKPSGLKADLKRNPDFSALAADVEGHGTLEQVLRAAATIQAQPWVHRVDGFSLKPDGGKERDRFGLKMVVETILLPPGLAPKEIGEPRIVAPGADAEREWAAVVQKNVFREPAALAGQPPPVPDQGPIGPAYDEWKLTGVVEGRQGVEAFLVNTKSGQRLTLPVGSAVADARFVSGGGELAVFEIDGKKFEVSNGQTLEQRRLVTR